MMLLDNNETLNTKSDLESLLFRLLNPLKQYYSDGKARLNLGESAAVYEQTAAEFEGFSRPLWGLVPFWYGGGNHIEFESAYQHGLKNGSDPLSNEYWGKCHDIDQRFVEMAALAYGILLTPHKLWEPLDSDARNNLADWLYQVNEYAFPPCNWMFFAVLVNLALKSVHRPFSQKVLDKYLEYIESCYLSDGWYLDGQNGAKDYYISFAFHYYSLIYYMVMKDEEPERCQIFRQRAEIFARDFIYWFAEDGSAIAYGRSLTYRFAQASFFSICAAAKIEVLPYPVMKGIILRHLNFWGHQPILDHAQLLTIGYAYPNLLMSEQYNAPGSPYWSMKIFACLMLPEEHPFWNTKSMPLPELNSLQSISNQSMIIQRLFGHVSAYTGGHPIPHAHVHTEAKYSKFVYSSHFAFSTPRSMYSLEEAAPDSSLAFSIHGLIYTKGLSKNISVSKNQIRMDWSPCNGISVHTTLKLVPNGHLRIHEIQSDLECTAFDCGFSFPDTFSTEISEQYINILIPEHFEYAHVCREEHRYTVSCKTDLGEASYIKASPNTNLMFPKTIIPCIHYKIKKGYQIIQSEFLFAK